MANPKLIDAHTHTQFAAFANDREAVIQRALDANIWLVNAGTQQDTSRAAVEIANKYNEGVYAAVGLHPIHTDKSFYDLDELGEPSFAKATEGQREFTSRGEEFGYEYYKKLAQNPKVVAIGECGLDYAAFVREQRERLQKRAPSEAESERGLVQISINDKKQKQKEAFIQQIKLAHELKKPLMIHCREAYEDLVRILKSKIEILNTPPGVVHFFSGAKNHAQKLLDMGFYFSFGGVITFTRDYDEIVKMIPLGRILLETDAPYVAPAPYRGKRNEPLYVAEVAKKISEIKNADQDEAARHTTENAKSVFGI